jgi:hypothetical protein
MHRRRALQRKPSNGSGPPGPYCTIGVPQQLLEASLVPPSPRHDFVIGSNTAVGTSKAAHRESNPNE